MKPLPILTCLCVLVALCGCTNRAPQGFPTTVSCQIVVTENGTPVEGVTVDLIPSQPMNGLTIGGKTDATGTAMVHTIQGEYAADGAPEGAFTVALSKTLPVEMPQLTNEQFYKLTPQQKVARQKELKKKTDAARVVPAVLSNAKSPLKLNIDPSGGKLDVDISGYKKVASNSSHNLR